MVITDPLIQPSQTFWQSKSVFVTGHTGFKGSWLSLWLASLGAEIHGYALDPPTTPCLFDAADVKTLLASDERACITDYEKLSVAIAKAQPAVVFHLAAQPLVKAGYEHPVLTFEHNIMGTVKLLEAIRHVSSVKAVVVVTTDKVYKNREWQYPYREVDALGGHDPYSTSKAAVELITSSYQKSFYEGMEDRGVQIVTARAGNVIGGGDWAQNRLVPDCLRAFEKGTPVLLRYPHAVRPWQHVLDPLCGYLLLAEYSYRGSAREYAWNFGPELRDNRTVAEIASKSAQLWGKGAAVKIESNDAQPHEAGLLRLDSSLALAHLQWKSRWSVDKALEFTVGWHQAWLAGAGMMDYSMDQIANYLTTDDKI